MTSFHLIFWRHAEADEAPGSAQGDPDDMARELTRQGRRDAALMAGWIKSHVPKPWVVVSSPAQRALHTAQQLNDYPELDDRLRPGAAVYGLLDLVREHPRETGALVLVGHQPQLGRAVLHWLSAGQCAQEFSLRKAGVLWTVERLREAGLQRSLRAYLSPDLLRD